LVFRRREEEFEAWDDHTLILDALMRIGAKLEDIERFLYEEDDEEDSKGS